LFKSDCVSSHELKSAPSKDGRFHGGTCHKFSFGRFGSLRYSGRRLPLS
jgi:hypothetical protein